MTNATRNELHALYARIEILESDNKRLRAWQSTVTEILEVARIEMGELRRVLHFARRCFPDGRIENFCDGKTLWSAIQAHDLAMSVKVKNPKEVL